MSVKGRCEVLVGTEMFSAWTGSALRPGGGLILYVVRCYHREEL